MTFVQSGPCGYLPGRTWTLEVQLCPDDAGYRALLETRHRRSGVVAYRPVCKDCQACVPLRVPVDRFAPTKSQRRSLRKNADLEVELGPLQPDQEKLLLHDAFLAARFPRSEPSGTLEHYAESFGSSPVSTHEMRYRKDGRLVGLGIVDLLPDVVSSVYFFHDPTEGKRSLGVFSALTEIELARRTGRAWWYVGYWVAGCKEMTYKADYRPHQLLVKDGEWVEQQQDPRAPETDAEASGESDGERDPAT